MALHCRFGCPIVSIIVGALVVISLMMGIVGAGGPQRLGKAVNDDRRGHLSKTD
ncbi:MAG: hypothetical protein A49_09600 [Methyloceanibacter sp.]|nr:MAG: hypothetical protein A49_09600 [Methyloceanibacter sp.]